MRDCTHLHVHITMYLYNHIMIIVTCVIVHVRDYKNKLTLADILSCSMDGSDTLLPEAIRVESMRLANDLATSLTAFSKSNYTNIIIQVTQYNNNV